MPVKIWEVYYNAKQNGDDLVVHYIRDYPVMVEDGTPQVACVCLNDLEKEAAEKGVSDLIIHPILSGEATERA